MRILIVGNGGREHAIAWGIYNSESFKKSQGKLYCTNGNPGINQISRPIAISSTETDKIKDFVISENIDVVVIGPEIPLSMGLEDIISRDTNAKVFGPSGPAAEIETSKVFAKDFMKKYKIPSAGYESFDIESYNDAINYLNLTSYPVVIKADGLAAGKGVFIAETKTDAVEFLDDITKKQIFGESGKKFIIEEFLRGFELSVFVVTDGNDFVILPTAQDHKKIGDNDTGKNTGGMGAYSPADKLIDDVTFDKITKTIIIPALQGMKSEGRPFKGCLYCGLMITERNNAYEPFVIEFNCRFGDPETQVVIPLIKSDFLELLIASAEGKIKEYKLEIHDKYAACVVAASKGYPDKYETGKEIYGLDLEDSDTIVFHSGTKTKDDKVFTNGGRVLSVVSLSSKDIEDSVLKSYMNISKIRFDNMYYRKDIGKKFSEILKDRK